MIKRSISLITALLIVLIAMIQLPLSVNAQENESVPTVDTETVPDTTEEDPLPSLPYDDITANGFSHEDGLNYFYLDGERIEHNWYRIGRYQTLYNRTQWLYELMKNAGDIPNCSGNNGKAVFELAEKRGIVGSKNNNDYYGNVDRLFVAQTLVKALGYPQRSVGAISDSSDADLSTIAYYGYFIPDDEDRLYPNALVTEDEFDSIISELKLYKKLKGKKLTVFGDSITYGYGNPIGGGAFEGIAEMIGRKYGMDFKKYSKSGAVMGITDGKSHIADQVRSAIKAGRQTDLIILNGGANDTWHADIALGEVNDGFDIASVDESDFTNGFEKAMWLIRKEWDDVPVIYLRPHKMALGSKKRQESIGERALELCEKWKAAGIDLYNESELNGNILSMSLRYSWDDDSANRGIHPNALGYAAFYLPPISENIASLFELTLLGDCNTDGEVNVIDVYYILRYLAGLSVDADEESMMCGDIDRNGELNVIDATFIQRSLAELDISPYAVGEII